MKNSDIYYCQNKTVGLFVSSAFAPTESKFFKLFFLKPLKAYKENINRLNIS